MELEKAAVLIQVTLGPAQQELIRYESEHCYSKTHPFCTLTPTIMGNKDKTRDGDATADRDHSHN